MMILWYGNEDDSVVMVRLRDVQHGDLWSLLVGSQLLIFARLCHMNEPNESITAITLSATEKICRTFSKRRHPTSALRVKVIFCARLPKGPLSCISEYAERQLDVLVSSWRCNAEPLA